MPKYAVANHEHDDEKKNMARRTKRGKITTAAGTEADDPVDFVAQEEWDLDIFDLVPVLLTGTPGWVASGLTLEIEYFDYAISSDALIERYGPDDGKAIRIRLRNKHYSAVVNGKQVDVPRDGNRFFLAIWAALREDRHEDAVGRLFGGRKPLTVQEGARRLRMAIVVSAGQEWEVNRKQIPPTFGFGEIRRVASAPVSRADKPVKPALPNEPLWSFSSAEVGPGVIRFGNRVSAWIGHGPLVQTVLRGLVGTSPLPAQHGELTPPPFDPTSLALAERLAMLPSWIASGLTLELDFNQRQANGEPTIRRYGPEDAKFIGIRLEDGVWSAVASRPRRRRAPGAGDGIRIREGDDYYSAIVNDEKVYVEARHNRFYHAVWDAIQPNRYVAERLKVFNGNMPRSSHEAASRLRREVSLQAIQARRKGSLAREVTRTLTHVGYQVTARIHRRALLQCTCRTLAGISPVVGNVASNVLSVRELLNVGIEEDWLGVAMIFLRNLPYHLLSREACLFAIAAAVKGYIDNTIDYKNETIESWTGLEEGQMEAIYLLMGVIALSAEHIDSSMRHVAFPLSTLGKNIVGGIVLFGRTEQGYAVLESVAVAGERLTLSDLQMERMPLTAAEKTIQRDRRRKLRARTKTAAGRAELSAERKQWAPSDLHMERMSLTAAEKKIQRDQRSKLRALAKTAAGRAELRAEWTQSVSPAPTPATSPGSGVSASKPLIIAGAMTVGTVYVVSALGDAAAVGAPVVTEHTILLVDSGAVAVAADVAVTTGGMRTLARRSPLLAATVGVGGASSYGLYRLIRWLTGASAETPISQGSGRTINETSASAEAFVGQEAAPPTSVFDQAYEIRPGAVDADGEFLSPHLPAAIDAAANPFEPLIETGGGLWNSSIDFDEMVDDFIISIGKKEVDFLVARSSIPAVGGDMFSERIDLLLSTREGYANDSRSRYKRMSADASNPQPARRITTNELIDWIRANWSSDEAFKPASDASLEWTLTGNYRSRTGETYLYIAGGYWKFIATDLSHGTLENEASKTKILLYREMPNFVWGFSTSERKRLKLGPVPDIDIPKPAAISDDLATWIRLYWGDTGVPAGQGGAIRFSDGIYENQNRLLFMKVNGVFWEFNFMSDKNKAELSNQNGEAISIQFKDGSWTRRSAIAPGGPDMKNDDIIENLFSYEFYSDISKSRLKEIVRAVIAGRKEISYSNLIYEVDMQLDAWFEKEIVDHKSDVISEIMLAQQEILIRQAHLRYSGNNAGTRNLMEIWHEFDINVPGPLIEEYGRSLSPGKVSDDVVAELVGTTDKDNKFTQHRARLNVEIDAWTSDIQRLENENKHLDNKMNEIAGQLATLRDSTDALNRQLVTRDVGNWGVPDG